MAIAKNSFKALFDLGDASILSPIQDLNKKANVYRTNFADFAKKLSPLAKFDSGLLSGLISYRCALGHEQIIVQLPPGIYSAKWGMYEGGSDTKIYSLAMPYRVIISDFENNIFVGSRHFFTLEPVWGWDTPLYATGFSNTNNLGYNNTSVGWICHYHNSEGNAIPDLSAKIDYIVNRESGLGEPYNYANMSRTDGPAFYQQMMPSKTHFHSADNWHKMTKKNGMDWVFNKANYIQYQVDKNPSSGALTHVTTKGSRLYTLRMAAFEHYLPYYSHVKPKPVNMNSKEFDDALSQAVTAAIQTLGNAKSSVIYNPPSAELPYTTEFSEAALKKDQALAGKVCVGCNKFFPQDTAFYSVVTGVGGGFHSTSGSTIVSQWWCPHCASTSAVTIKYSPLDINGYVALGILIKDWGSGRYFLPQQCTHCPNCGSAYTPDFLKGWNPFIYGADIEQPVMCESCDSDDEEDYGLDMLSGKNVYVSYLVNKKILVLGTDDDGHQTLVLQLNPVHHSTAAQICACGIVPSLTEEVKHVSKDGDDFLVCSSCVVSPLISVTLAAPIEKDF